MSFEGWPDLAIYAYHGDLIDEACVEADWLNSWSRQFGRTKEERGKHYRAYSSWGALYEWGIR